MQMKKFFSPSTTHCVARLVSAQPTHHFISPPTILHCTSLVNYCLIIVLILHIHTDQVV